MEQYIHTLIPVDSQFSPSSRQVASFYHRLVSDHMFSPISGQRWLPGLVVMKPSGKLRWGTNPMTGEKISIPARDRLNLEQFEDIPAAIEGCTHYTVAQSGQWTQENRPISLLGTDGVPFEGDYVCTVACEHRSEPVSTSAWDVEAGPSPRDIPIFGSPCNNAGSDGIFPNPWTGEPIEVADAGCALFWIEFEFGKFIYPKVDGSFDVMSPAIVQFVEECFGTRFAQGCRFW
jgi:hypothetical protein